MKARLPLRLLAGLFGILLFAYLVHRAGPAKLARKHGHSGMGAWRLVIALGGVAHVVKTWAWRLTLLDDKHQVSFARMLGLRLGSRSSWAAWRARTTVRRRLAGLAVGSDNAARQRDHVGDA